MNSPCSITNCPQDFAWHALAFREFQDEHGKPPVQRRTAGVGPHEFHIGQWWRGVLDLIRTSDPDSLSDELLTAVADLAAHKRPPRRIPRRQKMFASDLERAQFIIDCASEHGKLPPHLRHRAGPRASGRADAQRPPGSRPRLQRQEAPTHRRRSAGAVRRAPARMAWTSR